MHTKLILLLLLLSFFKSPAQISIKKPVIITQAEFDKHQPVNNRIDRPLGKIKSKGSIKIKTPRKTLIFKDDGEMKEYVYEGELKNYPIAVIHELEPNSEAWYLTNRLTGTVDTLLSKPIFFINTTDLFAWKAQGQICNNAFRLGILLMAA